MKLKVSIFFLTVLLCGSLFAQNHVSVHLENQVYHFLEQAEMRGLCAPLSGSRPYTQSVIVAAINEILNSEYSQKLKKTEREILNEYLEKYSKPKTGIDWSRGAWYGETAVGKNETLFSANIGVTADIEGSAGIYSADERYLGTEVWLGAYLSGDLGSHVSYELNMEGGLMKIPRNFIDKGHTYYDGFVNDPANQYVDRETYVYSEPLTHFPYSHKKRWDGPVYFLSELSSLEYWPGSVAGAYNLLSELTASFLENRFIVRFGRLSHDWGTVPLGSSLVLNRMARPFLGIEAEFNPLPWFGISSLTGVLEYLNIEGEEKKSSSTSQNAFSITMLQFKYKNYLFFDFIDSVVWSKRFELGYISPITNSFFYQNNIGDFDNIAITLNLKAQYPGLGNIWFSLFVDEMQVDTNWWDLDRTMIAGQTGLNIPLPFLAFSSLALSYTRVNPYCYTHNRNFNPWYSSDLPMETSYTNNGVSLGYYLPPNSDELLFRFKTMPAKNLVTLLQYQLIRHGATYGSSAVDGSSLLSELDPNKRDGSNPILKRFFLHDGAYQWMHIIRVGAEWNLPRLPVSLYGEAGVNYSYFTNTAEPANSGSAYDYSPINTTEYPKSTGFIVKIGFKVYPR